jgi:L-threonylcarbamoyladenylate synthase
MTNQRTISQEEIQHAASLLRAGKLVAFPTETVYGLGANALDPEAVARIFAAKGRPHTSPIIVHVASLDMARLVVSEWPQSAEKLAKEFWPGPLTLVLTKQATVPELVTAGLDTVGVRMPAHQVALALIAAAGVPVAAPSANRFTHLSPTMAAHVRHSLGDRFDYILDGGPCTVGIESTVLSLAGDLPTLLRPGGVSRQQIQRVIGPVALQLQSMAEAAHPSPGMHPRHYSPQTKLLLASGVPESGVGVYLQLNRQPEREVREVVCMPSDAAEYASQLYRVLHELDARGYDWIAVEVPPDTPEWEAVRDRLQRAATPNF